MVAWTVSAKPSTPNPHRNFVLRVLGGSSFTKTSVKNAKYSIRFSASEAQLDGIAHDPTVAADSAP